MDWYVNHDLNRDWIVLEAEFTLRALRNRAARSRMTEFNRQRTSDYSALVSTYFKERGATPSGPADVIAITLFAAARGLGELTLLQPENQALYAACRDLAFKQLIVPAEE